MEKTINSFWQIRLKEVSETLSANNFDVFIAENRQQASDIAYHQIIPSLSVKTISWGGSMTFVATGLYDILKEQKSFTILDTFEKNIPADEMLERRRQSLLVDLFISGTNALTEDGQLVNLDMIGNRIGAIHFGPRHVILFVGRNKIVSDVHEAMVRIKNYASPTNVMRLNKNTPCLKTSVCQDCKSPERICNVWTITEKSLPKKRIKIILINEDLGL